MENNELMKLNNSVMAPDLIQQENLFRSKCIDFMKKTHTEPNPQELKEHPFIKNYFYLPISYLEMELDELFDGLWQTKNFTSKLVANELVGELELHYFHPVLRTWICRIGAGAVQVQFTKGSDWTNIGNKIQNTLQKDYPHLKSECFRNACLSLGKSFGRDVNRKDTDVYTPDNIEIIDEKEQQLREDYEIIVRDFEIAEELKQKAKGIVQEAEQKGMSKNGVEALKNLINNHIRTLRGVK